MSILNVKDGNKYLYSVSSRYVDLDSAKVEKWAGREFLLLNAKKVFDLGVTPENFWFEYTGTSGNPESRMETHFTKVTDILSLFKKKPPFTHMEYIGWCTKEEAERLERLYVEDRDSFYLELFLYHGIFVWPWGPYYPEKGKGGSQKVHPFPDNKYGYMPHWFEKYRDIVEAEVAARNAKKENVIV